MTTDTTPPRRGLLRRTKADERPSEHRLAFLDHAALELHRVTGRGQLMQCVWVYEHPLNIEGLKRFHHNLYESLGSRLIERSPLPFGRPRWVRPSGSPSPIHFAEKSRPRSELMDWCDELARLPIDPEIGPGWHIGVQPMDDGSTGVSIIASHVIGDGVGALMAVFEAVTGAIRNPGYDEPASRGLTTAITADIRQAVRDLPLTLRTARMAVKLVREKRQGLKLSQANHDAPGDSQHVTVPSVALYVDIPEWDAKAKELGGNSYSLLAGYSAKMSEHLGRQRKDGKVVLSIAINLRESLDDDRALAMAFANAAVDPTTVTKDLAEARAQVREAREKAKSEVDPAIELMALMPWLPRRAVKGLAELLFSYSEDLPLSCSNLGDLPPDLARVDGTDAEYVFIRAIDTDVTLGELRRSHGQLVVVSGRINGKVAISIEAYRLGGENTHEQLRELAKHTLDEFGLAAVFE